MRFQIDGDPNMTLPWRFEIHGHDGFDYIHLDFANARGTRPLNVIKPLVLNMDLGALSDQVQIEVPDFPEGLFSLNADLGEGHDGMTINSYGGEVKGNVAIMIDAGSGNDLVDVNLASARGPYNIPEGSYINIEVFGDENGWFNGLDNVPDHGKDRLVVRWEGRVDGRLISRVNGDDGAMRVRCLYFDNCIFRHIVADDCARLQFGSDSADAIREAYLEEQTGVARDSTTVEQVPCDLEDALRNFYDYASDNVQTRYRIEVDSTGSVDLFTDGGLGDDAVVMVIGPPEDTSKLKKLDSTLMGGEAYPGQADVCWFDNSRIKVRACSAIDHDIYDVD